MTTSSQNENAEDKNVKQRHQETNWKYLRTFHSKDEWDDFWKNEKIWSCDGNSKLNKILRRYYRCNLVPKAGKQCTSRLISIENQKTKDFEIHVAVADHSHDAIDTNSMKPAVLITIIALHTNSREFTAKKIHKIFECLSPLPTVEQIQSRKAYHCQNEPGAANMTEIISVGDVIKWADAQKFTPDLDDDSPFVIDIKASNHESTEKHFQFVIATKRLLRNVAKVSNICVDATYKVVFHGYR